MQDAGQKAEEYDAGTIPIQKPAAQQEKTAAEMYFAYFHAAAVKGR